MDVNSAGPVQLRRMRTSRSKWNVESRTPEERERSAKSFTILKDLGVDITICIKYKIYKTFAIYIFKFRFLTRGLTPALSHLSITTEAAHEKT